MFITIIVCLIAINSLILNLYCRLQEMRDWKIFQQTNLSESTDITNEESKKSKFKLFYRWLNAYLYGYTRTNLLFAGKIPSHRIRKLLYRNVFRMKVSKKTIIYGGAEIRSPWNIRLGVCTIASNSILDGRSGIEIGDNVVLGSGVHIWTQEHDLNDPFFRVLSHNRLPVKIENYAWVCSDTTLLPGVCVKQGAVVAARACVTKDCDSFGVYAGIPAKKICERNSDLKYSLSGKPTWHFS